MKKILGVITLIMMTSWIGAVALGEEQDQVFSLFVSECSDQEDNDNDRATDFPADPQCISFADNSEAPVFPPIAPQVPARFTVTGYTANFSLIHLLREGQFIASVFSDEDGRFEFDLSNEAPGNAHYSLVWKDSNQSWSLAHSVVVSLVAEEQTIISDVLLPPSMTILPEREPNRFTVEGFSIPNSIVDVKTATGSLQLQSDNEGYFFSEFLDDSSSFQSNIILEAQSSSAYGQTDWVLEQQRFSSLTADYYDPCFRIGDLNNDCFVNQIDLELALYWFEKDLPLSFQRLDQRHLNDDKIIDFHDLSLIAFYWTG